MTPKVDKGTCLGKLRTFRGTVHHQRPVDVSPSLSVVAQGRRETLHPAQGLS